MKKIFLAAAITITSLVGLSAPSLAASTTVVVKRVDHHRPMARPMHRTNDCYVEQLSTATMVGSLCIKLEFADNSCVAPALKTPGPLVARI